MRGKLKSYRATYQKDRITPACAGKTHRDLVGLLISEDHPRVCGENFFKTGHISPNTGSPPRVRGKQSTRLYSPDSLRITPACAGKTLAHLLAGGVKEDHPRVCGENFAAQVPEAKGMGSPPRVRGKPDSLRHGFHRAGITPACAGKTSSRACLDCLLKDHPRVCGENSQHPSHAARSRDHPRACGENSASVSASVRE